MKAPNFLPYQFCGTTGGVEAGLHGELAVQSADECVKVAMYVAAEAPFRQFSVKRPNALQYVAEAIPQVRLSEGLERLNIAITPYCIVKNDGTPFAIVDKQKRMRLTRNLSEEERQAVLNYDFSRMDKCRQDRVAFYLQQYDLPDGALDIPVLTEEEMSRLKGKCRNTQEGLLLPMLRSGGRQMAIFDDSETVTIVPGNRENMNPRIYDTTLEMGLMLPLSEAFTSGLNDGTIRNFQYSVAPVGDNELRISVSFVIDDEVITHSEIRKTTVYDGGAFAICSFNNFGALLFSNDATLKIAPAEQTMEPCFGGNTWRVTRVRGGTRYVSVYRDNIPMGVVALPEPVRREWFDSVTEAFDLGDTSWCGIMFNVLGKPVPVQFDAARDVLPLIELAPDDRDALCNGSWFPVKHNRTARSISQLFRDKDGRLFETPAPYMVARPFIDQASGYVIARSIENGLYAGFKSRGLICCRADEEQEAAYIGSTAAILLIGLHQALQYTDKVKLRLSYPNNPVYKKSFQKRISQVLELVQSSLTDANGNGFVFAGVEYVDEASCNIAGICTIGINNKLGAEFINNIGSDMGGSTTDVSICVFGNRWILLPAIPIAGRVVTLSSLIQAARSNELTRMLRNVPEGMEIVIRQQVIPTIQKRLNQGLEPRIALEQMVHDPELMEAMQTLLDYFTLTLDVEKSRLLQSLICFKDLLLEDIILHQASRFYTDRDLDAGNLYLLRLGNGSRCVSLICGDDSPYRSSRAVLEQVLRDRAVHHIGQGTKLSVVHNKQPKTEVSNGLACYDKQADATIEYWQDEVTVQTPRELKEQYLEKAIERTMEQAEWLGNVVSQITGDIQPHYSGLQDGFGQLLKGLENKNMCRVALCDTITHENGRFGSIHQVSASMAVDVWAAFAIMDHVNRNLAAAQAALL